MTLKTYLMRATLVQLLVRMFGCDQARGQFLPVPQGYLTAADIQTADANGVIIGLLICCVVCFFACLYILICIENEVREVHRLIERVKEADLR